MRRKRKTSAVELNLFTRSPRTKKPGQATWLYQDDCTIVLVGCWQERPFARPGTDQVWGRPAGLATPAVTTALCGRPCRAGTSDWLWGLPAYKSLSNLFRFDALNLSYGSSQPQTRTQAQTQGRPDHARPYQNQPEFATASRVVATLAMFTIQEIQSSVYLCCCIPPTWKAHDFFTSVRVLLVSIGER